MIITLLAKTVLIPGAAEELGYVPHPAGSVSDGDELVEIAGRECYQSWGRPNPATATNAGYIENIIKKNHTSIMEHSCYTFSIRKVSRATTHELVRHRHLSPSQMSQRYVDESEHEFITPPEIVNNKMLLPDLLLADSHHDALTLYVRVFDILTEAGVPRKRARQAARYALPNGQETRLIVTGNIRAWRHFINMRCAVDENGEPLADLEMHELASLILVHLHREVPNAMQDLWDEFTRTANGWSSKVTGLSGRMH